MTRRNPLLAGALLVAAIAFAQEGPPTDVRAFVFDNFTIAGLPNEIAQVQQAIIASPELSTELHELAAGKLLTGIRVVQDTQPVTRGPTFQGFNEGSNIVLTGKLLTELQRGRLFDVVRPDDVLPNQTVFVLAHLAQHLRTAGAMRAALETASGPDVYAKVRLRDEAIAFIDAWNVTVDAATHSNGDMRLAPQQVASVLVNLRYRFAYLGKAPKVQFLPSGRLESGAQNIDAITERLKSSRLADIE